MHSPQAVAKSRKRVNEEDMQNFKDVHTQSLIIAIYNTVCHLLLFTSHTLCIRTRIVVIEAFTKHLHLFPLVC